METSKIADHRKGAFKNRNAMKTDELRRRREDAAIEIRKQKREESLAKRRNLQVAATAESDSEEEDLEDSERQDNEVSYVK